jgi:transposase
VVTPDQAATLPSGPQMVEVEIAGKLRVRIPANTPPALAAAILKALGVS